MPGGVGVLGRQVMGTVVGVARLRVFHLLQRSTEAQPVVRDVGEAPAFVAPCLGCRFEIAGLQPGLGEGATGSWAVRIETDALLEGRNCGLRLVKVQSGQSEIQPTIGPCGVFDQGHGQMLGGGHPVVVRQGLHGIGLQARAIGCWSGVLHAAPVSRAGCTDCRTLCQSLGLGCRKSRAEPYQRVVLPSVPQRQSGA